MITYISHVSQINNPYVVTCELKLPNYDAVNQVTNSQSLSLHFIYLIEHHDVLPFDQLSGDYLVDQ